jgi:hypothetical protein
MARLAWSAGTAKVLRHRLTRNIRTAISMARCKTRRPNSAALCKTALLIRGLWSHSTWLLVMKCDVVSDQLLSKVELSGAPTFRASDALASNYICREASIINFTRATASTAGNLLDDRYLRLVRMMDCAHGRRICLQERHGTVSEFAWFEASASCPPFPVYAIKRCSRSSVPAEMKERNPMATGSPSAL